MRPMATHEINSLIQSRRWATLCTVTPEGEPYAVEFSYFILNGCLGGMINPGGMTGRNLRNQPKVCIKICRTGPFNVSYEAASVFGVGRYEDNPDLVNQAWDLLEARLRRPPGTFAKAKEKCRTGAIRAPLFLATMERATGVTSQP